MKALVQEKETAILLRKKGYSYKEILKQVPVAKSSLSLWLKDLPLTKSEKLCLKHRLDVNISRGRIKAGSELRKRRLDREAVWFVEAKEQFERVRKDTLFHIGVALYWAEGSKRSGQWQFTNSDAEMVQIMLKWIEIYFGLHRSNLRYRLYSHKPYAQERCEVWWADDLGLEHEQLTKVTYKPTNLGVKKRPNYYKGCLRIEIPKSKGMLCKMKFWTNMIVEHYSQQE